SAIVVPWETLLLSVVLYILVPVVLAQLARGALIARGGGGALAAALGDRARLNCTEEMERTVFQTSVEAQEGRLARFLLELERQAVGLTQAGRLNRRNLAKLARRAGWPEPEAMPLADLAIAIGLVEQDETRTRVCVSPLGWRFLAATPHGRAGLLSQQLREAFHLLAQEIPFPFREALEQAIFAELDPKSSAGAKVCLHCAARRVADAVLRSTKKRVVDGGAGFHASMRASVELMAGWFFRLGWAEGALAGGRLRYLRWKGPEEAPPEDPPGRVTVQPTGEVIVPPGALTAEELARLARAAEPDGVDPALVFTLTRASVFEAAREGEDLARLREILEARSGRPLPQTVAFHLEEAASRAGEVRIVPCSALVEVREPSMLEGLDLVRVTDRIAAVPPDEDPEAVLRALEKKGYFVKMDRFSWPALASDWR
ncbi:MAG: helicase-associated domain-containing protein, partial [Planctomycetota bacterium]